MNKLQKAALVFTVIGGINWGLIGFLDFNLVSFIFGFSMILERIIYAIVGISAIINIALFTIYLDE